MTQGNQMENSPISVKIDRETYDRLQSLSRISKQPITKILKSLVAEPYLWYLFGQIAHER